MQFRMRRRVSGVFSSVKMNRSVPWRSHEERDLAYLLELDPDVESFGAMPHKIAILVDESQKLYYPSYEIRSRGRVAIADVVSSPSLNQAKLKRKQDFILSLQAAYRSYGIGYRAYTKTDIRLEPRFSNAKFILSSRRMQRNLGLEFRIKHSLADGKRRTLAEIRAVLPDEGNVEQAVCQMVLQRALNADLGAPSPNLMQVTLRSARAG